MGEEGKGKSNSAATREIREELPFGGMDMYEVRQVVRACARVEEEMSGHKASGREAITEERESGGHSRGRWTGKRIGRKKCTSPAVKQNHRPQRTKR